MNNFSIRLIDLPDELILIIFKKLNNVELLYSLMNIDRQLDRILYDSIFTDCLTLTRSSFNGHINSLDNQILDRLCRDILPKIHHKIQCLTVESLSMERILLIGDYPTLHKLCLASMEEEKLRHLFNEENSLLKKFQHLSTFHFSVFNKSVRVSYDLTRFVFKNMFKTFPRLINLQFHQLFNNDCFELSFGKEISIFSSCFLLELHITVCTSTDFLCLLDGRFNALRHFYVYVRHFFLPSPDVDMKKKLNKMKRFSLTSNNSTFFYNQTILPLLHRMSNLKMLTLNIIIEEKKFVDGNCLNNDIINHLPKLNHFIFNIQSRIYDYNQTDIRSNEDIQNTFKSFQNHKINSYVDYFPEENFGQCHYYSYPYTMKNYGNISNHFSDGLFTCVTKISLFDERPFQHEFFLKISQSFPFLEELTINNLQSQNKKSDDDNNEHLPIIKYPHLTKLYLINAHDDYIEQFLLHSKSVLTNYISLSVRYYTLYTVTNDFTREETKINSAKIKHFFLAGRTIFSKDFREYFPNLKCNYY
ncbi:unnamed protein product [Rotaria socialis]|uniref:F-box domain-containing protein n=2 Tax=Rotaria socialis TaxID=392032 RepID=A0A820RYJ0_9BILA|nr:unnamed protein product [Rotaria socialis]CAF3663928.1 unnamed protein product [Rotaria socialis]CAF3719648.1 unnamed protein product [Rotaria socialis]CAF4446980.1 unnamed protein product [Rotaria socialis]CAF4551315.1 unnamed protein product [Rotaria socialis]